MALARILQHVTVHMKSGRTMEGGLVSRAGSKITITRGRGKVTLTDSQYDRLELGEAEAVGESKVKLSTKAAQAKPERASAPEVPAVAKAPAKTSRTKRRRGRPRPKSLSNKKDGSKMVYVPAGTFKMGSDDGSSKEKPVHDLRVEGFYIGKHEVTNRQFKKFVDANPDWRRDRIKRECHDGNYLKHWEDETYPADRADHPVVYVSWFAARAYCKWAEGRLPTEAEWEKACRAGSTGKYCFGDDEPKLWDYAWYGDNSDRSTHPVGQKRANEWGLHDMHGNVWEWTNSLLKPYPYKADDGREDSSDTASSRVLRGGAFDELAPDCRAAYRIHHDRPTSCDFDYGFRLCVPGEAPN